MAAAAGASAAAVKTFSARGISLGLDAFAYRQWDDPSYKGTRMKGDKQEFIDKVNELVQQNDLTMTEGYAPFCRHIFVGNIVDGVVPGTLAITDANRHLLRSGYSARRPEELPVLSRWFRAGDVKGLLRPAKFLDLILYSREQIAKEKAAMDKTDEVTIDEKDPLWSVISIKAQDEAFELPMAPITMMRNTLIGEGGSGVPIDREAYMKSVEYWQNHAVVQ
ncbi:unnamed protein product [Vitrella brassicaformis CCMP3155]|uniref:Flagellar associated protein n=2 Tax=Vitrella brassicaformis TaxID=1169539 RepID=A0A0G4G3W6_VITBC|nr:unnamed protein product [Vitrella brassicaformis CCMP3155]|eukprot:CEM23122.1 unnamed protein product [Vitrella brassicaformis CCMP3155]